MRHRPNAVSLCKHHAFSINKAKHRWWFMHILFIVVSARRFLNMWDVISINKVSLVAAVQNFEQRSNSGMKNSALKILQKFKSYGKKYCKVISNWLKLSFQQRYQTVLQILPYKNRSHHIVWSYTQTDRPIEVKCLMTM